jgi:hypothetical protein
MKKKIKLINDKEDECIIHYDLFDDVVYVIIKTNYGLEYDFELYDEELKDAINDLNSRKNALGKVFYNRIKQLLEEKNALKVFE